jgi:head-tail adaptor
MFPNLLKDRIQIQRKTTMLTAAGETEIWTPVQTKFARVIPLDAKAIAQYQQLNSVVTHRIIFRGSVDLGLGTVRFKHGSRTYEPVNPPQEIENTTVVLVREV